MDSPSIAEQAERPYISTRRLLETVQQLVSEARRRLHCNIDGKNPKSIRRLRGFRAICSGGVVSRHGLADIRVAAGGESRVAFWSDSDFIKGSTHDGDRG
jgi:hypothetical protein